MLITSKKCDVNSSQLCAVVLNPTLKLLWNYICIQSFMTAIGTEAFLSCESCECATHAWQQIPISAIVTWSICKRH